MRKIYLFTLLAGLALLMPAVKAQTNPQLLSVARVVVKPDRLGEYMDVGKQYAAAYKKGGGTLLAVYRNSAGNPFEFLVIAQVPNYGALDGKSPYAKGTTETELARMAARRAQCTESVRTTYERTVPSLGFNALEAMPKGARMTRIVVRGGMEQQWMDTVKNELAPALKKAGYPSLLVRRVEWGGSRNVFTLRVPYDKFGELDEQSALVKSLGADAAAKLAAKLGSMSTTEWLLYTYQPELSVRSQQ